MSASNDKQRTTTGNGATLRQALFCVGIFYLIMVFFNGAAMQESAQLFRFGAQRDALCLLNRPLDALSRHSGACKLRAYLRATAGTWLNKDKGKKR